MADRPPWSWDRTGDVAFVRKALILLAAVAFALLLWQLSDVLLLAFGAVLVAVILHALAQVLERYAGVPPRWSLAAAGSLVAAVLVTALVLFGAQLSAQIAAISERLPLALNSFGRELGIADMTGQLKHVLGMGPGGEFLSRLAGWGGAILGGLADAVLVAIAGIYIAAAPRTYQRGLVKLFPPGQHRKVEESLAAVGQALRLWLVAQLVAMVAVGVLASLAYWLIGLPSPLALGLIAGLADFIPFVGPIIGALPAVLIAASQDTATALWTIGAVVLVQQVEGNVIFPLAERQMVSIPPALALFAIVAGGVLFGTLGLIFGFPLAVVAFVLVKKLYIRETLGERTFVPGEDPAPGAR
jgi:predicted PurR-regulated permease PerM